MNRLTNTARECCSCPRIAQGGNNYEATAAAIGAGLGISSHLLHRALARVLRLAKLLSEALSVKLRLRPRSKQSRKLHLLRPARRRTYWVARSDYRAGAEFVNLVAQAMRQSNLVYDSYVRGLGHYPHMGKRNKLVACSRPRAGSANVLDNASHCILPVHDWRAHPSSNFST